MSKEIENAMKVLTEAMQDTDIGSYAHGWHCNIAMMCYDAMGDNATAHLGHEECHRIANDGASRFMQLCFNVTTSNNKDKG
tara:strand:- start:247 stop:489 length:243 start_codon:yes stop_codon:yes gene_type:complete